MKHFLLIALFLFGSVSVSNAQSNAIQNTGRMEGWVRDAVGAVIPDANLTILCFGKVHQAKTDKSGFYKIVLPTDSYEVTLEKTLGFKSRKQKDVRIILNKTTYVNFTPDFDFDAALNITTFYCN